MKFTPAWITAALVLVITAAFIIGSDGTYNGRLLIVAALPFLVACIAGMLRWEGRRGRGIWRPLVMLQSAALLLFLASGLYMVRVEALARTLDDHTNGETFSVLKMAESQLFDEWCILFVASGLMVLFLVVLDFFMKPVAHDEPPAQKAPETELPGAELPETGPAP